MRQITYTFMALILLVACAPKTAEVVTTAEPVTFPSSDVAEGSKLYAENCGKCHKLKAESNYTQEEWKKIVPRMAVKAKIDAAAENKVLQYVLWKAAK